MDFKKLFIYQLMPPNRFGLKNLVFIVYFFIHYVQSVKYSTATPDTGDYINAPEVTVVQPTIDIDQVKVSKSWRSLDVKWQYKLKTGFVSPHKLAFSVEACERSLWGAPQCKRVFTSNNETKVNNLKVSTDYTVRITPFVSEYSPERLKSLESRTARILPLARGAIKEEDADIILPAVIAGDPFEAVVGTKDYSVGQIKCDPNMTIVEIETGEAFDGIVSVMNSNNRITSTKDECRSIGTGRNEGKSILLKIDHKKCPVNINNNGLEVMAMVIVQESASIVMGSDKSFKVVCNYLPSTIRIRTGVGMDGKENKQNIMATKYTVEPTFEKTSRLNPITAEPESEPEPHHTTPMPTSKPEATTETIASKIPPHASGSAKIVPLEKKNSVPTSSKDLAPDYDESGDFKLDIGNPFEGFEIKHNAVVSSFETTNQVAEKPMEPEQSRIVMSESEDEKNARLRVQLEKLADRISRRMKVEQREEFSTVSSGDRQELQQGESTYFGGLDFNWATAGLLVIGFIILIVIIAFSAFCCLTENSVKKRASEGFSKMAVWRGAYSMTPTGTFDSKNGSVISETARQSFEPWMEGTQSSSDESSHFSSVLANNIAISTLKNRPNISHPIVSEQTSRSVVCQSATVNCQVSRPSSHV